MDVGSCDDGVLNNGLCDKFGFFENAQPVQVSEEQTKINALGLLARGSVLSLPSFYSYYLIILLNEHHDKPVQSIKVVIKDPDRNIGFAPDELLKPDLDLIIGKKKDYQDLLIAMTIQNLIVEKVGHFTHEIFVNGELDYSSILYDYLGKSMLIGDIKAEIENKGYGSLVLANIVILAKKYEQMK